MDLNSLIQNQIIKERHKVPKQLYLKQKITWRINLINLITKDLIIEVIIIVIPSILSLVKSFQHLHKEDFLRTS